ncbi:hypothetical protein AC1031_010201 [Aphanomyces cochlioides]|nr:hypothetical protein AC1031_010201 [Aphanomyces cochlioides]
MSTFSAPPDIEDVDKECPGHTKHSSCGAVNAYAIAVNVKNSIETRILEHLATYDLRKNLQFITDDDLCKAITARCKATKNSATPDIPAFFKAHLKMDLKESDVACRVMNYFVLFNKLIEDNGLAAFLKTESPMSDKGRIITKLRCKLLIANLAPDVLKLDIERLVEYEH